MAKLQGGTKAQIAAVLEAGLMPKIIDALANADFDVKKEPAWAISNATCGQVFEHVKYMVDQGALKPLCDRALKRGGNLKLESIFVPCTSSRKSDPATIRCASATCPLRIK